MSLPPLQALLDGRIRSGAALVAWRDGQPVCWEQLRGAVGGLAARLRGARVALREEDGYAFCVGLLAAACAGCPVLLLPPEQPALLADLTSEWDCLLGEGGEPILTGDFAAIPTGFDLEAVPISFFTSGSTAQPKRIERSFGLLGREVNAVAERLGTGGTGCHRATVPHHHAYGLIFKLLWPLLAGRPFAARSYPLWETLLADLAEGDWLISGPAHLRRIEGLVATRRPAGLLSAGAPLPAAAATAAARLFACPVMEILGSTETGAIASRPGGAAAPWKPLPGARVWPDPAGLLTVEAPWIIGASHGADQIRRNGDEGFALLGRADRVVKIEGKRVGLAAIEAALAALPEVVEAAALVLPGAAADRLAAAVVLSEAGQAHLAAEGAFRLGRRLRAAVADRLEPAARPRHWRFVTALPHDGLGKCPAAALAALFLKDVADV